MILINVVSTLCYSHCWSAFFTNQNNSVIQHNLKLNYSIKTNHRKDGKKSMIPSAPEEILQCIFPEDASQFSASDQSDEEAIEKEPDDVVLILLVLGPKKCN